MVILNRHTEVINNRSRSGVGAGVWQFLLDPKSRFCQKTGTRTDTEFNLCFLLLM